MDTINQQVLASRFRANTDVIAACAKRPDPARGLFAVVQWVRELSRSASEDLRIALRNEYPTVGWGGEEEWPYVIDVAYWIHDAVDGAYHFLQGLPLWSSSLALVEDGRAILGYVYDPSSHEMFAAQGGQYLTAKRFRRSQAGS